MNELFEFPEFEIKNKIRLIELFGGIGSQAMALRDIGADFEHYRLVEFDKYPVASYNAIHGTSFVPTDITKIHGEDLGIIETETYTYIMTYSFPCQDLSLAGKRRGMSKGKGTRSGLLWEVERLLGETQNLPQVLLMENVPQVIGEKNKPDFDDWCAFLKKKGYQNYYQVLNAKDYGIAQNRERCFMISILSKQWFDFKFPKPEELKTTVRDYLEDEVDEKYYINNEKASKFIRDLIDRGELPRRSPEQNRTAYRAGVDLSTQTTGIKKVCTCICARYDAGIINHSALNTGVVEEKYPGRLDKVTGAENGNFVGTENAKIIELNMPISHTVTCKEPGPSVHHSNMVIEEKPIDRIERQALETFEKNDCEPGDSINPFNKTVDKSGICPTITTRPEGFKTAILLVVEDKVQIKQATKEGSIECKIGGVADLTYPDSKTRRGRVQDGGDTSPTITAEGEICRIESRYRIRKLTPKECWRLMGYTDADFEKAQAVNSNTQLYKQAGNAIVKQVLMGIFRQLNIRSAK